MEPFLLDESIYSHPSIFIYMESIFESTFKKYVKLTLEGVSRENVIMTDDQNVALKNLYIILKNCLEDIYYECRSEKININNCETKFPKFLKNYIPKNPYITVSNYETLILQLPRTIKDCFDDLQDEFFVKIVSKEKPILKAGKGITAKAGLERNNKSNLIYGVYMRFDILLSDISELKSGLQHELQHIYISGEVDGLKDGEDKIHAFIEYLGDKSEISAYAKEYAYRYNKKYPRDGALNVEKLKKLFYNKKSESFNHYIFFGEDADAIKNKYDVKSSEIKKMNKIHDEFIETLKSSLNYFL